MTAGEIIGKILDLETAGEELTDSRFLNVMAG